MSENHTNSLPLPLPQRGRVNGNVKQRHVRRQRPVQDTCHDIRCKCGQVHHPAHVAAVDPLLPGNLPQPFYLARLQHGKPPMPADERQLQGRWLTGQPGLAARQGHKLPPTAPLDLYGNRDSKAAIDAAKRAWRAYKQTKIGKKGTR